MACRMSPLSFMRTTFLLNVLLLYLLAFISRLGELTQNTNPPDSAGGEEWGETSGEIWPDAGCGVWECITGGPSHISRGSGVTRPGLALVSGLVCSRPRHLTSAWPPIGHHGLSRPLIGPEARLLSSLPPPGWSWTSGGWDLETGGLENWHQLSLFLAIIRTREYILYHHQTDWVTISPPSRHDGLSVAVC